MPRGVIVIYQSGVYRAWIANPQRVPLASSDGRHHVICVMVLTARWPTCRVLPTSATSDVDATLFCAAVLRTSYQISKGSERSRK